MSDAARLMRYCDNAFTLSIYILTLSNSFAQICLNQCGCNSVFDTLTFGVVKHYFLHTSLYSIYKYPSRTGKQWCVGSADQPRRRHPVLQPVRLPVQVILSTKHHFKPTLSRRNKTRGWILGRNPDKSLKSFPPCYSQSPIQLCFEISISSNSRNVLQFLEFSYCTL